MNETQLLVQTARDALRTIEKELLKAEYFATCGLPQVADLQGQLRDHAERIASGLVALARVEFRVGGVYVPEPEG